MHIIFSLHRNYKKKVHGSVHQEQKYYLFYTINQSSLYPIFLRLSIISFNTHFYIINLCSKANINIYTNLNNPRTKKTKKKLIRKIGTQKKRNKE